MLDFPAAVFAPGRTVFDDPIEQGALESDVVACFLALDPFVDENFFTLGKELAVEDRVLDEIRVF